MTTDCYLERELSCRSRSKIAKISLWQLDYLMSLKCAKVDVNFSSESFPMIKGFCGQLVVEFDLSTGRCDCYIELRTFKSFSTLSANGSIIAAWRKLLGSV